MERAEGEPFSGWVCDGKGDQFPITAKGVIDASGVAAVCSRVVKPDGEAPLNQKGKVVAGMQYELL